MTPREKFYTAEPIEKQVTKEEFDKFVKEYPRKLTGDCCGICEPPSVTFNDFALANRWPHSVVARTWSYSDDPHDRYYEPEENRHYYVVVNHEELFNSRTGYEE